MPRPIHFEISADDPQRALAFYQAVFGWTSSKWEGPLDYWLIQTGEDTEPGINGGLMQRMSPEDSTVNTVQVSSVDECLEKVTAAGGTIAMPKMAIPGIGYVAYCKDTEGNVFGVMHPDPAA
jgi:predicted enzyme related to lactoylglutathione lyase